MSKVSYKYIEDYLRSLYKTKSDLLSELREYAEENHVPIIEEECEEFYNFLINTTKPKKILELGTAIGYSAISFSMNEFVERLVTVEINEDMVKIAKKNIKESGLEDKIEIVHSDAYEYLVESSDTFDFIFIDAAKGQYEKYFDEAIKLLNRDGIIVCDNVLFRGMIANQELVKRRKITIVKRLRKFLKDIKDDDRFYSSIVPIGDGALLIRRKFEED
ncbi:O-methyltransferase [Peptoniphilus sp.]|uniref:O-methyltransferase n=1 Tax=Peptoniphilus sp. TaxID=1971214 RepID=UPI0039917269